MSEQDRTEPYDVSQDDALLLAEMDTFLKERWQKAVASRNDGAQIEVGQALAYLAGMTRGRLGMTAAELEASLEPVDLPGGAL